MIERAGYAKSFTARIKAFALSVAFVSIATFPATVPTPAPADEGQQLTLKEASESAKKLHDGKVLDAQLVETDDDTAFYRVKILSDGQVLVIRVDAVTGDAQIEG